MKLEVVDAHAALLLETIEQFLWAANYVVDHARQDDGYVLTDSGTLHERTYETVRDNRRVGISMQLIARARSGSIACSVGTRITPITTQPRTSRSISFGTRMVQREAHP